MNYGTSCQELVVMVLGAGLPIFLRARLNVGGPRSSRGKIISVPTSGVGQNWTFSELHHVTARHIRVYGVKTVNTSCSYGVDFCFILSLSLDLNAH